MDLTKTGESVVDRDDPLVTEFYVIDHRAEVQPHIHVQRRLRQMLKEMPFAASLFNHRTARRSVALGQVEDK